MNEEIRAAQVRLVGPSGTQLGVVDLAVAMAIAESHEMDLVEIAPQASPPVCKVIDWSKEQYQRAKQSRLSRYHQSTLVTKEIQLRVGIATHDLLTKAAAARRFLESGARVRVVAVLYGRLASRPQEADALIDRFIEALDITPAPLLDVERSYSERKVTQVLSPGH
jgi:translation initiation factor IF-3